MEGILPLTSPRVTERAELFRRGMNNSSWHTIVKSQGVLIPAREREKAFELEPL